MKQLKIIEKNIYDIELNKHISSNIILSNNEFDNSISVKFHLVNIDELKFVVSHEPENFVYENTFNFIEKTKCIKEIIIKIEEVFKLLDIVISKEDTNTIYEILSNIIDSCKNMNGKHIDEYNFYGKDANFSILGNELNDDDYFYVEIKNHHYEEENLEEWMFNMKHSDKRMIMNAYAEYSKESVIWYISNNSDNVEYTDLIDYLLENFTGFSIQSDKSIIIDLD